MLTRPRPLGRRSGGGDGHRHIDTALNATSAANSRADEAKHILDHL
jgi:hypothetical protein